MKFIENNQKFPEEFLGFIIVEILKALEKCKSKGITYPDVKPDNILLNLNGAIKLCGFGNSNILHNSLGNTFTGKKTSELYDLGSILNVIPKAEVKNVKIFKGLSHKVSQKSCPVK